MHPSEFCTSLHAPLTQIDKYFGNQRHLSFIYRSDIFLVPSLDFSRLCLLDVSVDRA